MAIDIVGTIGISTAAVVVADANDWRDFLSFYNAGAGTVMLGPSTVGSLNGYPVPPATEVHWLGNGAVYAIGASTGTNLLHFHEVVA